MSTGNYGDSTITIWEIDDDGEKVSIPIRNEQKQVIGNKFTLEGIPDEGHRVFIDGFVEVDIKDKITEHNQFKVDYRKAGTVFVHESLDGQWITISSYNSRGLVYYPASRIWTKVNEFGEVMETLDSVVDNIEPLTNTILNFEEVVDTGKNIELDLNTSIDTANVTKYNLDSSINDANAINDTLLDETDGTIKQAEDMNTNLSDTISLAQSTNTTLSSTDSKAQETKSNLNTSISTGDTLKTNLDNNISTGSNLNENLETNIITGNKLKTDLPPLVEEAETAKEDLDASVNTANITKDNVDDSINAGLTIKSGLDDSVNQAHIVNDTLSNEIDGTIKQAIDSNNILTTTINTSNISKSSLDKSTEDANISKTNLDSSINDANTINDTLSNKTDGTIKQAEDTDNTLNATINIANTTNTNLDKSIDVANATKVNLDDSTSNANTINDILIDEEIGTIKQAADINNDLNSTISTATTSKSDLDNSISTANTTKTNLDTSITDGDVLKGELDSIISGTDYEALITDVADLKTDKHNHTNKTVINGLSDVDGQLLYNGQDVGVGDMTKAEFDVDGDGKVDIANNAERLDGNTSDYYAKTTDIPAKLSQLTNDANYETTIGSQTKADTAETNAKDYADAELTKKVDKVTGKGLSTNDYTTIEKNKLSGIQANAQVNTVTSVAGKTGAVVVSKFDVGLSNVDNVKQATKTEFDNHDINTTKHITSAERTAWNAKETPSGAQAKADAAEQNAKNYTDSELANFEGMSIHGNDYHTENYAIESDLVAHQADDVSQGELHGFRLTDGKLEYFDGLEWQRVRGDGYPVGNISNFNAESDDKQITLAWQDPDDVIITDSNDNVITIARWKGTKVLRKTGSYPQNENDGVLVVDNGIRNQYLENGFTDIGLQNDVEYFYMAFPYTKEDVYTVDEYNRISVIPTEIKIYGIEIDESNSNPFTRVTYTDDATGFTPCTGNNGNFNWGSWEEIIKDEFKIKPCVLNNPAKTVNYYLDYNDRTKKEDGTNSILTGADGDVMTEFGQDIYWKWDTVGDIQKIQVSIKPFEGAVKEAFEVENGYNQLLYYPLLLTQILFSILFKSTDSQEALGRGYVDGNSGYTNTGGTNTKGFMYGETTGKQQMSFLGIEDYWGNRYQWTDGLVTDANFNLLIGNSNFNDTGSGYTSHASGVSANTTGYINTVQGGNDKGFIIKGKSGSETTHYADYGFLYSSRVAYFGGYHSHGSHAGAFLLRLDRSGSNVFALIGSRLFCKNNGKLYIGAYLGTTQGGKLRSVSGTTPSDNKTIGVFRNEARANNV